MSGFSLLFRQWQQAEAAALRAERRLSRRLDAYCEGWGQAPTLQEIGTAQARRARARELLHSVRSQLARQRDGAPVL